MALVQSLRPSLSTAREPFTSSGRGGSGNIRRTSVGRSSEPSADVSDVVSLREKEGSSSRFVSVGRGGVGNIQPPSPDLADHPVTAAILNEHRDTEHRYERQIRKRHEESKVVASSGRGGSGNINHNRRSKSRPPGSTSVRKGRRRTSETTTIDALHLISGESLSNITLADRGEGTSRSGTEPVDGPSCSPTSHNFQQRSTKQRKFLKLWKRSSRPRSSISSLERISIADITSSDVNQRDSDSSIDYLSLHRASTSGHSGDTASTVSSYTSSGSRSLNSSHMSVQSLPTLPENREYVSFLDL